MKGDTGCHANLCWRGIFLRAKQRFLMIQKLMSAEYVLQYNLNRAQIKLLAFRSIKKLLSELDLNAEEVPDDLDKFRQLLESLKGEPLTGLEHELINELLVEDYQIL